MNTIGHFWGPGHVAFGRGCIRELDTLCAELDARQVLVIVDRHVRANAALQAAVDAMREGRRVHVAEHDGSEPSLAQATELAAAVEGAVGATEQESDEGYFAVGSDTMLVAKPRSALHQWLRSHNGQQVRVTIELNQPTQ